MSGYSSECNYDAAAGIHYGVISQHSGNPEAMQDIWTNGDNLSHQAAIDDAKERIADALRSVLDDLGVLPYGFTAERNKLSDSYVAAIASDVWEAIEQDFNDRYEEQDDQYRYEQDGYVLLTSSLGIYVVKSPFYTFTRPCSPCCPNAGDLNTPSETGLKTYCLGLDWFDSENPCPYPVYRVEDGSRVEGE